MNSQQKTTSTRLEICWNLAQLLILHHPFASFGALATTVLRRRFEDEAEITFGSIRPERMASGHLRPPGTSDEASAAADGFGADRKNHENNYKIGETKTAKVKPCVIDAKGPKRCIGPPLNQSSVKIETGKWIQGPVHHRPQPMFRVHPNLVPALRPRH